MSEVKFRWLGVAGIELVYEGFHLLTDPYLTRVSFLGQWTRRLTPNLKLIVEKIQACDSILVTHSHFDHLMDVPAVLTYSAAAAYGSPNTCKLLERLAVSQEKIREIEPGHPYEIGPYKVTAFLGEHEYIPFYRAGKLGKPLNPPLYSWDYRMDNCMTYLVQAGAERILTHPYRNAGRLPQAHTLFLYPHWPVGYYAPVLESVRPARVIPIHWDNFWRPLHKPLQPSWRLPSWGRILPQRVNLGEFEGLISSLSPGTTVLRPEIFQEYILN